VTKSVLFCSPFHVIDNKLHSCADFDVTSDFMSEVVATQTKVVVKPDHLITKCIKVVKGQRTYLVDMPNMVEME
jgi:hypothetical protein